MTIRIINKCQNSCLHCMEESSPTRTEIMSFETFSKTLEFIDSTITDNINISGGEATLHPQILLFLEEACKLNKTIYLLINGLFLKANIELRNKIFILMSKYRNLRLQVTSIKGLYSNFIHRSEIEPILKKLSIYKKIEDRILFVHKLEYGVIPVGRAKEHMEQINKISFIAMDRTVPKCFNPYNIIAQLGNKIGSDIRGVIDYLKMSSTTSLCVPLIKENGDMIFGEYEACNVVWNVHDSSCEIKVKDLFGSCGSCYANQTQVDNVNKHLGIFINKHNKIKESVWSIKLK